MRSHRLNSASKPTHALFSLAPAPTDPIFGIQEAFDADRSPDKVNLGVGVYLDKTGACPLFAAVRVAQQRMIEDNSAKSYLPIDGGPRFNAAVRDLVFPTQTFGSVPISAVQTLGGTGALRLAAELLSLTERPPKVWLTKPTWSNHQPIFEAVGLEVGEIPYLDNTGQRLDSEAFLTTLDGLGPRDVVVLHGCCHNPTGVNPDETTWRMVASFAKARGWLPLIDLAYAGLGAGLERDLVGVRSIAAAGVPAMVALSCSKIFGLYGERTGALMALTNNGPVVLSRMKQVIRRSYSNPPRHGAHLVATVLASNELRILWSLELLEAQRRIQKMRSDLCAALEQRRPHRDYSFLSAQKGMFSMLPITPQGVSDLREQWHVYMPKSGRINFAALTDDRIQYVADALAKTLR